MRYAKCPCLILLALAAASQPLRAQAVDLTDSRTAEEKWTRSVYMIDYLMMSHIAYAKSLGQAPDQLAEWMIGYGSPTWGAPGSRTIASFVRGMFRNYNLYSNLEFEILSESESEVRGRMNSPYAVRFGETGESNGVTLRDYQQLWCLFYEGIANYLGFNMTHEVGGEWITFTVRTR